MKMIFLMTTISLLLMSCSSIEDVISTNLNNKNNESIEVKNDVEVVVSDTNKNVPDSKPIPKMSSKTESIPESKTNATQTPIPYKMSKTTEPYKTIPKVTSKLIPTSIPIASPTSIPSIISEVPSETELKFPLDNLTLVNFSKHNDQEILELEQLIRGKINHSVKTKTISIIYPVGEQILPERQATGTPFMAHEVSLKEVQIIDILSTLRQWIQTNSYECSGLVETENIVSDIENWIRSGADPSSMSVICENLRIVTIGIPKNSGMDVNKKEFQNVYIHERYHSEQKDFGKCSIKGDFSFSNALWFNEGAAHYFSTTLLAEMERNDPQSEILRIALRTSKEGGDSVFGQPDKWGAAALLLLTELDQLSEESIMNGSLFYNCAKENEFDKDSILIKHVRKSWYLIEEKNNIYTFTKEALTQN